MHRIKSGGIYTELVMVVFFFFSDVIMGDILIFLFDYPDLKIVGQTIYIIFLYFKNILSYFSLKRVLPFSLPSLTFFLPVSRPGQDMLQFQMCCWGPSPLVLNCSLSLVSSILSPPPHLFSL